MDTKDLLNDSSIHHGRNLVCLMNRKGFKVEDLEKALQLSQKQVEELTEMKKEDKTENPERLVGTYLKPEKHNFWHGIPVNGRHWIKVV